ncbi:MAG: hypothetical protein E5X05_01160 [Mesorhizobium sp.]|nr:MAG: hypothetical protein E5X05_01160 [Mesorhizobium sp.]
MRQKDEPPRLEMSYVTVMQANDPQTGLLVLDTIDGPSVSVIIDEMSARDLAYELLEFLGEK